MAETQLCQCSRPGCSNIRRMAGAVLDATRAYRYRLERIIGPEPKTALFVMLNPSTADETTDDPTIRRCIAFAKREGCGRLLVCNLYAFRATDPKQLRGQAEPIGPDNADHLRSAAAEASLIVAAWGSAHLGGQWPNMVLGVLAEYQHVHVLRITGNGDPGHPLYVPADAPLVLFRESAQGQADIKPWGSRHPFHGGAPDA